MSAQKAVVIKCVLIGIGLLLSSLSQAALGGDLGTPEILFALSTAFAGALAYAGIGYQTNLEATGKSG